MKKLMKKKRICFTLEEGGKFISAMKKGEAIYKQRCYYCRKYFDPYKEHMHFMSKLIPFGESVPKKLEESPKKFVFVCKDCYNFNSFNSKKDLIQLTLNQLLLVGG